MIPTINTGADDDFATLEWPDGYQPDPKAMAKFVPLVKKLGLPKQTAQELARLYVELDQDKNAGQAAMVAKTNANWLQEVRAHPEFGGANLQRTSENVAGLMRRFGSPLLMSQVRLMNVQNWPEMFYFLARVSQAMAEDCSPSSGGSQAAVTSTANLLFPDLN